EERQRVDLFRSRALCGPLCSKIRPPQRAVEVDTDDRVLGFSEQHERRGALDRLEALTRVSADAETGEARHQQLVAGGEQVVGIRRRALTPRRAHVVADEDLARV